MDADLVRLYEIPTKFSNQAKEPFPSISRADGIEPGPAAGVEKLEYGHAVRASVIEVGGRYRPACPRAKDLKSLPPTVNAGIGFVIDDDRAFARGIGGHNLGP